MVEHIELYNTVWIEHGIKWRYFSPFQLNIESEWRNILSFMNGIIRKLRTKNHCDLPLF